MVLSYKILLITYMKKLIADTTNNTNIWLAPSN